MPGQQVYLSRVRVPLALPVTLVPLQVGLLQGESTQSAAQREEEDGQRAGRRAQPPKRLEEG